MITSGILLAAGMGTRMKSNLPKVLHPLLGRPLIFYALDALQEATGSRPVAVIGYGAEVIRQVVGDRAEYVVQEPLLGTGHAVQQTDNALRNKSEAVLVMTADMPLLTAVTLQRLVDAQQENPGPITMLTVIAADPRGFGRVVRGQDGKVLKIVEEAQATQEQLAIRELNASVYCFNARWLWDNLSRLPLSPKGEYYLTDLVGIAVQDGLSVQAISSDDPDEMIGINTRVHLAEAEAILRQRVNMGWMLAGVTIVDPAVTYIEPGVSIARDTIIWPNTYLQGNTTVGEACELGPNTIVRHSSIGNRCRVVASILECAELEDDVDVGPFSHLRKGAHLGRGVHLGNFGEVKNSTLGPGTKMGHFSYIGDADIGPHVNIGAGTITCNLSIDGKKNQTEIGEGAFIGSDTMLVAPVKVGPGAATGSGSVVTKNVPADTLVAGLPARAIRKLEKRG
jgi:bifunctional UDP-N-acetylglucosamine pyrophosphorylase/glucosamine-1-phosphate N-acetyltransferase